MRVNADAKRSQHLFGAAVDIARPKGMSIINFHAAGLQLARTTPLVGAIGYYPTHLHVDVRSRNSTGRVVFWGKRHRTPRRA